MNAVSGIFAALAILFGGGYALEKIHQEIRKNAVTRLHSGMPSLVQFTNRMTCAKIDKDGRLIRMKCGRSERKPRQKRSSRGHRKERNSGSISGVVSWPTAFCAVNASPAK
jgi:hypothetical protein